MVKQILPDFPAARSDDAELQVVVYRKFYWRQVRVRSFKNGQGEWCMTTTATYDNWRLLPNYESLRRRRQELQHDEREKLWAIVAKNHQSEVIAALSQVEPSMEKGEAEAIAQSWRKIPYCRKEFEDLAEGNPYLPSKRVMRKRTRAEAAYNHDLGRGQLGINDYVR